MPSRRSVVLGTLATAAASSIGFQAARADLLGSVKSAGVLRIATPQDSPPFGVPGPDMKIVGYDIDIAELLAQKLGVKAETVPTTSSARVPYLQTKRVDIIVSSLGKNPEREQLIDFSIAYAPYFLGVFTASNVRIAGAADLAGKTVGVTRGAIDDLELTRIAPASATIQRFEDTAGQIAAYVSGQVDIIATANVAAAAIARQVPNRAPVLRFMLKDSPCFIGVPKGESALLRQINDIILAAKADGTLNALSKKWFFAELPADF